MTITSRPINSPRLPTFLLLGHSNADGWASVKLMLETYPHLMGVAGGSWVSHRIDPEKFYWQNCYVATSAKPFPLPNHTPVASTIDQVAWLELTANNPTTPDPMVSPHPHAEPYAFPNNRGSCYANYYYNSYKADGAGFVRLADFSDSSTNGALCGVEVPFMWYWRHYWGQQVGMSKLAFSSSFGMAADGANDARSGWIDTFNASAFPVGVDYVRSAVRNDSAGGWVGWWTPAKPMFDWAPNTDRFFGLLLKKLEGASEALPAGVKMDVRLIVPWIGDNDALRSLNETDSTLMLAGWKGFVLDLTTRLRKECASRDWSQLPAHEIPVVWPKIHKGYGSDATRRFMNGILTQIAADDPYFSTIEVDDLTVMSEEGYSTLNGAPGLGNHFGHKGYYNAAKRIFDAFQAISTEAFDAIADEDRVTFEEVINNVKTYYNRGRSQTDTDNDVAMEQHINGALDRILNDIGDNAYWLRRKQSINYDIGSNNLNLLPRHVSRVLKIEAGGDLTRDVAFREIGRGDGGRVQIHIERTAGESELVTHYMFRPRPLSSPSQLVPLPRNHVEWLVAESALRLARSGGNTVLMASLAGEVAALRDKCLKDSQVQVRTRRDTLYNRESRGAERHRNRWVP